MFALGLLNSGLFRTLKASARNVNFAHSVMATLLKIDMSALSMWGLRRMLRARVAVCEDALGDIARDCKCGLIDASDEVSDAAVVDRLLQQIRTLTHDGIGVDDAPSVAHGLKAGIFGGNIVSAHANVSESTLRASQPDTASVW